MSFSLKVKRGYEWDIKSTLLREYANSVSRSVHSAKFVVDFSVSRSAYIHVSCRIEERPNQAHLRKVDGESIDGEIVVHTCPRSWSFGYNFNLSDVQELDLYNALLALQNKELSGSFESQMASRLLVEILIPNKEFRIAMYRYIPSLHKVWDSIVRKEKH